MNLFLKLHAALGEIATHPRQHVERELAAQHGGGLQQPLQVLRQAVDAARDEMVRTRQELRSVKHALRADIESLEGWVKFINIALVPLLIGAGGFAFAAFRRRASDSR